MESNDLLEQEEAFHKLNAEIELRTRQLFKDVEAVVNKQRDSKIWPSDYFLDNYGDEQDGRHYYIGRGSVDLPESPYNAGGRRRSYSSGGRRGRSQARKQKDIIIKKPGGEPLLPPCASGLSAESLSRFLKAKGKMLQEDLELARRELQLKLDSYKKVTEKEGVEAEWGDTSQIRGLSARAGGPVVDEYKRLQHELKTRDEEKLKTSSEIVQLRDKVKKFEVNTTSLADKLQMRDSENALLKKEVDLLKQELKKMTLSTSGQDAKLNKVKEENEKLKAHLRQIELNEKETRDKFRKKTEVMQNTIRRLDKQKNELISAIKKQVYLIENLKKQKGLIEAEGALNFTEKEFLKLLEGKYEDERR